VLAIRRACKKLNSYQLEDCTIYSSCEPCPMCLGAIYWARPLKLVFASPKEEARNAGFDDEFIYSEINKHHREKKIIFEFLEIQNSKEPFEIWEKKENKTKY
jgi:guanine deaminase